MKKLTILSAIAMSGLIYSTANAQMSIRLGFHFGTPVAVQRAPVYEAPATVSYDDDDDYYYLPDVGAYYSVNEQCYYYYDGDSWISAAYLPGEYRDYDWRTARRYEVRAPRPYMHDEIYRSKYHGHEVDAWAHGDNHEHFNAPAQRDYGRQFDNRFGESYQRPMPHDNGNHFENREQGGYNQPAPQNNNQRWGNHGQGGFSQPSSQNNEHWGNRGQGNYGQPAPQNNGQRFNNSEQGSTSHSAQPNRGGAGYNQPSNQNSRDRGNSGGGQQHYTSNNSPQGGFSARRMTRF